MKRTSINTIAAMAIVLAAGSASVEAQGLRIGFSHGGAYGPNIGRIPINDPSILERARLQQEKNARKQRGERPLPSATSPQHDPRKAAATKRAAAQEAAREAARDRAARKIAADQARQQARLAAQQQAAAKAKSKAAALQTPPAPTVAPKSNVETAQEAQRDKAEEMLRKLSKPAAAPSTPAPLPVAVPAALPVKPAPVRPVAPVEVATPAAPPAPVVQPAAAPARPIATPVTQTTAAPSRPAPAAVPASGDCSRFIPGAGITVKVPCTE